jgi:transcriptional regulator with XRE-family HTH domain
VAKGKGGKGRGAGKWVTSPSYRTVIATIVEARKSAGFTQRTLAEALAKPPSFIAKVEQRERRLDVVEFIAIARALRLKEADLLRSVVADLPKRIEI